MQPRQPPPSLIPYEDLIHEALRGAVRAVLERTLAADGLPGDHHFYVSFDTRHEDVRLSRRLTAQHPDEMTIVLQHQFDDFKLNESGFGVRLSFGGVSEAIYVPFAAVTCFFDPSVSFRLLFAKAKDGREKDGRREETEARQGESERRAPSNGLRHTLDDSPPESPRPREAPSAADDGEEGAKAAILFPSKSRLSSKSRTSPDSSAPNGRPRSGHGGEKPGASRTSDRKAKAKARPDADDRRDRRPEERPKAGDPKGGDNVISLISRRPAADARSNDADA